MHPSKKVYSGDVWEMEKCIFGSGLQTWSWSLGQGSTKRFRKKSHFHRNVTFLALPLVVHYKDINEKLIFWKITHCARLSGSSEHPKCYFSTFFSNSVSSTFMFCLLTRPVLPAARFQFSLPPASPLECKPVDVCNWTGHGAKAKGLVEQVEDGGRCKHLNQLGPPKRTTTASY